MHSPFDQAGDASMPITTRRFYQPVADCEFISLSAVLRGSDARECVCVCVRGSFLLSAEKWIRCLKGDEEIILQIASIWLFFACVDVDGALVLICWAPNDAKKASC
jgi:hypothetical protein